LQDSKQPEIQNHHRRKRVILKPETGSDESNTNILIENDHFSITNLSTSHSSLNNTDGHEPSINSEALTDADSLAFPPIPIIGTPYFTSHSTPDIIHFLRSLVNAHSTVLRISETSWELNNKNQLLLFAPSRDIFFILVTNTYPSIISKSSSEYANLFRSSLPLSKNSTAIPFSQISKLQQL
jgi:hypothetical protein